MKFSDMMGPSAGETATTDGPTALTPDVEPPQIATPPETPIRLAGNRSEMEAVLGELQAYAPPATATEADTGTDSDAETEDQDVDAVEQSTAPVEPVDSEDTVAASGPPEATIGAAPVEMTDTAGPVDDVEATAASVEVLPTDDIADPAVLAPPSIADVMTELTPESAPASTADPDSWLDGLGLVDDDLLPSS